MKIAKKIILASASPRRKQILEDAGFSFSVEVIPVDEEFDLLMDVKKVPKYLSRKKILEFNHYDDNFLIISADTVVIVEGEILNKPADKQEAKAMLNRLSGKSHRVITGVSLKCGEDIETFSDETEVWFKKLSDDEISFYIDHYSPFDKAGGYGVQDFIGMIGIERINGSFYNVMGLPIHRLYQHLKPYIVF